MYMCVIHYHILLIANACQDRAKITKDLRIRITKYILESASDLCMFSHKTNTSNLSTCINNYKHGQN